MCKYMCQCVCDCVCVCASVCDCVSASTHLNIYVSTIHWGGTISLKLPFSLQLPFRLQVASRPHVHVWRVSRVHGARVHAGSPQESKRRALHLSSFSGIRHGRSAPRIVHAISFPFGRRALRMPCAQHVLREDRTERGAGAGIRFTPSRSFSPDSPLEHSEWSEDAKG